MVVAGGPHQYIMSPLQLVFVRFILCGFLFGVQCITTTTAVPATVHDSIVIHVNTNATTANSCIVTTLPNKAKRITKEMVCPTLNLALQAITSISTIYLYPFKHTLKPGNETQIGNRSAINIIGIYPNGEELDDIIVNCQNQTGLSFIHTNNIVIESVVFLNCSRTEISTSRNFLAPDFQYFRYQVAIFMKYCINVSLFEVTVSDSDGVGMTLYNTVGTITIANCTFKRNDNPHGQALGKAGGGGLQIELSDKLLCSETCMSSPENIRYSSNTKYTISSTEFSNNGAHYRQSYIVLSSAFRPGLTTHEFNFGKGGGFSIIMRGAVENNTFDINDCDIHDNDAHWGGGFYVSFQESSSNNTVRMRDTQIESNKNFDVDYSNDNRFDIDGGGGGGKILYSSAKNSKNNKMVIERCTFKHNFGVSGGGLWVESVLGKNSHGNRFELLESRFVYFNRAFLGSAVYFSGQFMKHTAHAIIQSTRFEKSSSICERMLSQQFAYLPCSGALYAINFPLVLKGKLLFQNNNVTALEIHDGSIDITEGSELIFFQNSAKYGGALALYDCSFMVLYPNTSLNFTRNTAEVLGGAIYSASCSGAGQPAAVSFRCFVGYSEPFLHPDLWNTVIMFDGNTVGVNDSTNPNDMYVTSLQACWWPQNGSSVITKDDYGQTFCWRPWKFNENCNTSYQSSPAFMYFNVSSDLETLIYPGQALPQPIVYDGAFRPAKLTAGLIACVLFGVGSFSPTEQVTCTTSSQERFLLYWPEGKDFKIDSAALISMQVNQKVTYGATTFITFKKCEWPLYLDRTQCVYEDEYFICDDGIKCGISSPVVPKRQYCISTYDNNNKELVIGLCPPLYSGRPTIDWLDKEGTMSVFTGSCSNNQSGRLCGGCEDGYAVPLNSLHYFCYKCDEQSVMFGWAMFLMLQILPLTLLVLGIFVFGVDLTTGRLTVLVFYWQMVSLNVPSWYYPAWFSFQTIPTSSSKLYSIITSPTIARFCTFIYSITNLDFLVVYEPELVFPICISRSMDALSAITFWYVVPIYALALTAIITLLVKLYYRGYLCVRRVAVPVHRCLARLVWGRCNINTSVVKSVVSVYILCFTQISATSFQILHFCTWHSLEDKNRSGKVFFYNGNLDYFGMPHAFFGVLAIIILLFLVILPMVFITLYPSKLFHRFVINKIKNSDIKSTLQVLGDTFTGCYKSPDGQEQKYDYRYFAGLLLFLRLMTLCFYYIPGQYSEIILYLETVAMLFLAGAIMIFRPFVAPFANYISFFLISTLVTMTALCLMIFDSDLGYAINILGTVHIPLLLILVYGMKRLIARLHSKLKPRFTNTKRYDGYQRVPVVEDDDDSRVESMRDFADRVEHPEEYESYPQQEDPHYQEFSSISKRDSGLVCANNTGSTIQSADSIN